MQFTLANLGRNSVRGNPFSYAIIAKNRTIRSLVLKNFVVPGTKEFHSREPEGVHNWEG